MLKLNIMTVAQYAIVKQWAEHKTVCDNIAIDDWDVYWEYAKNEPNTTIYAILDDDILVGKLTVEKDGNNINIDYIISPELHGKGIGTTSLSHFTQNAEKILGYKPTSINAYVEPEHLASVRCLEKSGFVHTGTDNDNCMEFVFRP